MSNSLNKSPSKALAEEIASALEKASLVDIAAMKKAEVAMAGGMMKRDDWRLLLDPRRPQNGRARENG
jgi:hypothetical protein